MSGCILWRVSWVGVVCAVVLATRASGDEGPPAVTRPPVEIRLTRHDPHPSVGDTELIVTRIDPAVPREPKSSEWVTTGRVCIVVENSLYPGVSNVLSVYQDDLLSDGFSSFITLYSAGTAESLRATVAGYYAETQSLAGLVMAGDIPYTLFEETQEFPGWAPEYEVFPCDLFYMDLNGNWLDQTNSGSFQSGVYDTRTGDLDLEIWACRIRTDTLTGLGSEVALMTNYFARDHSYHQRQTAWPSTALIYNDDDWISGSNGDIDDDSNSLVRVFGERNLTVLGSAEETTADDYKTNQLTADYDFLSVRSHGYATEHCFYENSHADYYWVYSSDYRSRDPASLFYSLYICQAGDFTVNNYLGGTTTFNPEGRGLLTWTSTKRGGLWNDLTLYEALARGECAGEAFRLWFNASQASFTQGEWAEEYWYGMVLLGDASLCLREPTTRYVAWDGSGEYPYTNWATAATGLLEAVDAALSADVVLVTNGVYVTPATIHIRGSEGRDITVRSVNGATNTTINGGYPQYTNQCLNIDNAEAVIEGFTITDGHASGTWPDVYGGGIQMKGPVIVSVCQIVSNSAPYGGGVYADGGGSLLDCFISNNTATAAGGLGGGVYSMGHSVISNCCIADNDAALWGGGLVCRTLDEVMDCEVLDNHADEQGGGLYVMSNEKASIERTRILGNSAGQTGGGAWVRMSNGFANVLFAGNTAPTGGGLYCVSWPTLVNCTVSSNQADVGGGIFSTNGIWATNCIIAGNTGGNFTNIGSAAVLAYCCVPEGVAGSNNIAADPDFMCGPIDPYRPSPLSPCVDAGFTLSEWSHSVDLRGAERIQNGILDIGAYESFPPDWDSDADQIPDIWEWQYIHSLTNMLATNDLDLDTVLNLAEYIANTDPTNSNDYFCVTAVSNHTSVSVSFFSSSNRLYTLKGCTNLPDGIWSQVPGCGPRTGAGGADSMDDTNVPLRKLIYRVGVAVP